MDLLSQRPVDVLIPAHDGTIEAIRDRRDEVEKLCAVALSSEPGLGGAIDRNETFRAATDVGVRLPAFGRASPDRATSTPRSRRSVSRRS